MKRLAFALMLVSCVAVHTGCRTSSTCSCHRSCCPTESYETESYDAVPVPEPEEAVVETASRSIDDGQHRSFDDGQLECVGGSCQSDFWLPPTPEADQEA